MTYTPAQLQQVENLASIFVPISDIATYLEVPAHELRTDIADFNSPVSIAYRKGKLTTKLNLRNQEIKLAQLGSPTALDNADKYLMDMEDDE